MSNIVSQPYSPIHDLLVEAVRIDRAPAPVVGTTQKDMIRSSSRQMGKVEGICEGIAAIITGLRSERYPSLKMIPKCSYADIHKLIKTRPEGLGEIAQAYDTYEARVAEVGRDSDNAEGRKAHYASIGAEFERDCNTYIEALVQISDDMAEAYENERRAKILSGEALPEKDDYKWLELEWTKMQDQADRIKKLSEVKK